MSSHLNRILTAIAATALLATLLAGCTGTAPSTTSSTAPAPAASSGGDAAPAGDVRLEFWHIQTTEPTPTIIQNSINRFQEANPSYKVNVVVTANDAYKQKLAVAMGSGQTPDIYPSWSGGPMIEYINAGHVQDLTALMEKDGYKDQFLDAAIAQATYNGKIYGVPVENVAIATVFYNKELYAEYGLSVPTTIAELEANCDAILAQGKIPFSLANKSQWTGSMYYMNFATRYAGLEPFNDAVSGTGSFEDEAFVFAGNKVQEWVDKNYFNPGFNGADEDSGQSRQLLYTDEAVMTVMGSWFASTVNGENPDFYKKIGAFNFPAMEGGKGDPNIVIGTVGDNFYHVSGTCADVDGAFRAIASLLDETSVKERVAANRIPPLKNITLEDPVLKEVMSLVNAAPAVQLWYDQYLPPEVSDLHKTTSQEIFGKTMTPEEANAKMEAAMAAYREKNK